MLILVSGDEMTWKRAPDLSTTCGSNSPLSEDDILLIIATLKVISAFLLTLLTIPVLRLDSSQKLQWGVLYLSLNKKF